MKKARKTEAKLKRRQHDYDTNVAPQNKSGFHRPGSLKK